MRGRILAAVLAATMLAPATAPAQMEPAGYDPAVLEGCLRDRSAASERAACIGIGAARCRMTEAGSSNAGIGFCFGEEHADWDARLNAAYATLLEQQGAFDAELRAAGSAAPSMVEALRAMQRAWIAYRDAACDWEASQWGGGSGAGPASLQCLMEVTARQALILNARIIE